MEYKNKPCPFCGYQDEDVFYWSKLNDLWVECTQCEAEGPPSHLAEVDRDKAMEEALKLWNKRANES